MKRPITVSEFRGTPRPWSLSDVLGLVAGAWVAALLAGVVLGMCGCSDATSARRALTESGFKDVITTGYAMFGCSDSDGTCTGFIATSPSGQRVEGFVGCGYFFKGCTVRLK